MKIKKNIIFGSSILFVIVIAILYSLNIGYQWHDNYQKKYHHFYDSTLHAARYYLIVDKVLFTYPEYKDIIEHPLFYFDDVLEFLKDFKNYRFSEGRNELSDYSPHITYAEVDYYNAICTMQTLPVEKYLEICEISEQLLNEGHISEIVFHVVLYGANNYSVINSNKNDKEVRKFLNKLLSNPNISKKYTEPLIRNYLS